MNNRFSACGSDKSRQGQHPFSSLPSLADLKKNLPCQPPPGDEQCFALWDKYGMLENVRRHSLVVARIATALARRAVELGMPVDAQAARSAALLHDLAKTYCLHYGGSHAMLGASWTLAETRDYGIAQGVMLHVHWPWELPAGNGVCITPLFVIYADKRAMHDSCVSLEQRFDDLLTRYGHTETARAGIRNSYEQAQLIERSLSGSLKWNLNEDSFDCGRLVQ